MGERLKIGCYWAAGCGGCDVATLDIHEKILEVLKAAELVFWPVAMDIKYKDVEAMADEHMDVCLFNGGIRNSENEFMARLLRRKAKILVAFGSCAHLGGIPSLANQFNREEIFEYVYKQSPSTHNPEGTTPQPRCKVPEGELTIPTFYNTVRTLDQTVDVDYFVPGCPPSPHQVWAVMEAIISGRLPPPGSVVGAADQALCEECPRTITERSIKRFVRPHATLPRPEQCFMEQGLFCMGSATRGGCGSRCIKSNMPCRGCYGPVPGVLDQGAKVVSALGSIIEASDPQKVEQVLDGLPDPLGSFYRFGLAASLLHRRLDNAPADPDHPSTGSTRE